MTRFFAFFAEGLFWTTIASIILGTIATIANGIYQASDDPVMRAILMWFGFILFLSALYAAIRFLMYIEEDNYD